MDDMCILSRLKSAILWWWETNEDQGHNLAASDELGAMYDSVYLKRNKLIANVSDAPSQLRVGRVCVPPQRDTLWRSSTNQHPGDMHFG
jgi:hypothetical protein